MNKNVILAIIAIILIAIVGFFVFSHPATTDGKMNTQIKFLGKSTLKNGGQVVFELEDAKEKELLRRNVSIEYDDGSGNIQKYSVLTDREGKGYLDIDGEAAGEYKITVAYNGTDKYNGCSANETITIEEGDAETTGATESNATANTLMYNNGTNSSSDSNHYSNESQTFYDAGLNVYYDINGTVIGGQNPEMKIYELIKDKMNFTKSGTAKP